MKILVGKVYEGERRLMVVARRVAHMPPIQIRGSDAAALAAELLTVLEEVGLRESPAARAAP